MFWSVRPGLDGVMRLSSEQYRNSLGTTGILDSFNIGKVLFNILMTAFYGWVYAKWERAGFIPVDAVAWPVLWGARFGDCVFPSSVCF